MIYSHIDSHALDSVRIINVFHFNNCVNFSSYPNTHKIAVEMYEGEQKKYQSTIRGKKTEDGAYYEMSELCIRAGTCFLKFLSHKKTPNEVTLNAISVPFRIAESSSSSTSSTVPAPTPTPPLTLDPKNIASLQMMAMKFLAPTLQKINSRLESLESNFNRLETRVRELENT